MSTAGGPRASRHHSVTPGQPPPVQVGSWDSNQSTVDFSTVVELGDALDAELDESGTGITVSAFTCNEFCRTRAAWRKLAHAHGRRLSRRRTTPSRPSLSFASPPSGYAGRCGPDTATANCVWPRVTR